MSEIKLAPNQKRAVELVSGALLVKASAGSGKTRVLTERIKNLLTITRRNILAITFTNKAGQEMKERLEGIDDLQSRVFIGTFHGFCQQIIEQRYNLLGLNRMPQIFEDDNDRLTLIEQAIQETPSIKIRYEEKNIEEQKKLRYKTLEFISKQKRKLYTPEDLIIRDKNEEWALLYSTYQDILTSQGAIDFDDLILLTFRIFTEYPKITALYRREYEYICVDEAQDLNNAQYQLLKALTGTDHKNVMMVGDPNQSIFGFNGSSAIYMNKCFVEDFQPSIIELKENFRSSREVIKAALKIMPNTCKFDNLKYKGIFELLAAEDEQKETSWIIKKINDLISLGIHNEIEGQITYEKIAVLARNKFVFGKLEEQLKSNNIPYYYKVTPGAIKFESKVMKAFDLAMRISINPKDSLHIARLIKLYELQRCNTLSDILTKLDSVVDKATIRCVLGLQEDGSNFKKKVEDFRDYICEYTGVNLEDDEKNLTINEINDLLKHWQEYAKKNDTRSLVQFKNAMSLGQTHSLSQANGVTLSTVHTMKGQENEIVFLMGMDEGTFPDYRAVSNGAIEMEQEKNNAYVAFTRAKRFLFVSYPLQRQMPWGDIKARLISRFLKPFIENKEDLRVADQASDYPHKS